MIAAALIRPADVARALGQPGGKLSRANFLTTYTEEGLVEKAANIRSMMTNQTSVTLRPVLSL